MAENAGARDWICCHAYSDTHTNMHKHINESAAVIVTLGHCGRIRWGRNLVLIAFFWESGRRGHGWPRPSPHNFTLPHAYALKHSTETLWY